MINYKYYGVLIGEKHSFNDFGLVMTKKVISKAEPKLNLIEVPASSEMIDLSEAVSGGMTYNQRTISLEFQKSVEGVEQAALYSNILEYWNSSRVKIIFDDEISYYWSGRATAELTNEGRRVVVTVEAIVEPYKLDIQATDEDWLWDPFDFEFGYITEGKDVVVSGTRSVYVNGLTKRTYPTIISSAPMEVTFDGVTYPLKAGINAIYDLIIKQGENELTFTGNGVVTIQYRGGLL